MARRLLSFLLLYFPVLCEAQTLNGIVVDAATKMGIPFASVSILTTNQGAIADLEGNFSLQFSAVPVKVKISCVGYETRILTIEAAVEEVRIELNGLSNELAEVVIKKGTNPALSVIERASRNRAVNNPDRLKSYSYQSYNKVVAVLDSGSEIYDRLLKGGNNFANQDVFISESVVRHRYKKPAQRHETIVAHKTSGTKSSLLASLLTDFQPFTFYDDWFVSNLTDRSYLSPLAPSGIERYDFELLDTLIRSGKDSTYVISFEPKPSERTPLLAGFVHINSQGYAIENIVAYSDDEDRDIRFRIQQQYRMWTDAGWFPDRCYTLVSFKEPSNRLSGLNYYHKSVFSNITGNAVDEETDFGPLNREMVGLPAATNDSILAESRRDSLSVREKNTYRFFEENKRILKQSEMAYQVFEIAIQRSVSLGRVDLPIKNSINYNNYEGLQVGIGFRTNRRLSEVVIVGGSARYGIRDGRWKYLGELQFNLFRNPEHNLKLVYTQNVEEPASSYYFTQVEGKYRYREFSSGRMDRLQRLNLTYNGYISSNWLYLFGITREIRNPEYVFLQLPEDKSISQSEIKNSEIAGLLRYRMGEKRMNFGNGVFVIRPPLREGFVRASAGVKALDSGYEYLKLDVGFSSRFATASFGETSCKFAAGYVMGHVPYSYLYHGESAGGIRQRVYLENTFQTMDMYEFLADKYFTLFIRQNFGQRFWHLKSKVSAPEISFSQGIYFGDVSVGNQFYAPNYRIARRGYFESGVIIDQLLRIRYLKVVYIDLGFGSFLRLGSYSQNKLNDNLSFRLLGTVSF